MVPLCHAAQMSSQVWKTFHVCHLVIITSQETTTTMSSKNSGCNSPLFSLSIIYFSYKNVRKCKRKKTLIVISQREDFGLNPSYSLFNIMNDKEKQQFLTFKKLKSSKRLIFLLEKWLKWLIKCSCFVLCTYIIWCLTAKGEDFPWTLKTNKQTQQVNRSTDLRVNRCFREIISGRFAVFITPSSERNGTEMDGGGWRIRGKKRGGGGEEETKEGGDEREKTAGGESRMRCERGRDSEQERNANHREDPRGWKGTNDDDVSVHGGSISSCC